MKRILLIIILLSPVPLSAQIASFTVSMDTVCQDSCITLINTSTGTIDSIKWVTSMDTVANPRSDTTTLCFLSAGVDTVRLFVFDSGRVYSSTKVLSIKPMPHPMITDSFPCGLKVPDIYLSYEWYHLPGYSDSDTTYFNFFVPSPGPPHYVIVDSNGCLGRSDQAGPPCGDWVKNVSTVNHEITLYPNPTTSQLTILSTNQPINHVAITNLLGQTTYTHQYDTKDVQIDVADLPSGMYLIKINGSEVRKFVKQ
jgi:hypothetical protein